MNEAQTEGYPIKIQPEAEDFQETMEKLRQRLQLRPGYMLISPELFKQTTGACEVPQKKVDRFIDWTYLRESPIFPVACKDGAVIWGVMTDAAGKEVWLLTSGQETRRQSK